WRGGLVESLGPIELALCRSVTQKKGSVVADSSEDSAYPRGSAVPRTFCVSACRPSGGTWPTRGAERSFPMLAPHGLSSRLAPGSPSCHSVAHRPSPSLGFRGHLATAPTSFLGR